MGSSADDFWVFVGLFATACAASSAYGFLIGSVPFGPAEAVWSLVALRRLKRRGPIGETGASPTVRGEREVYRFDKHQGSVTSVGYTPTGRMILSGSLDKTVRLLIIPTS